MIESLTVLLLCQLAGEVVVQLSGIPVPGPVLGMVLLFMGLLLRGSIPEDLRHTSLVLLGHLSLLFVPAGVGIMLYFDRVADEWLAILLALLISTLLTLVVTALTMTVVIKLIRSAKDNHE